MKKNNLIEGFWDCDQCDKKGIKARYDACPCCGKRRDENTRYYLIDPKNNRVSEEEAKKIDRRPDWLCKYCNSLNRASMNNCYSCGAPREAENKDYFENKEEMEQEEIEEQEIYNTRYDNISNEKNMLSDIVTKFSSFNFSNILKSKITKIGFGVTVAILFISFLVLLFTPTEEVLEVKSFSWKSSISVEEYITVNEEDWYLPANARLRYTKEEIKSYDRVIDHYEEKTKVVIKEKLVGYDTYTEYEDLGNGYFEEKEYKKQIYEEYESIETYKEPVYKKVPIYATKYYYEIDKWVHKETITENGNDKEPYYPQISLKKNEREEDRNQTYFISAINEEGKKYELSLSLEDWEKISVGQNVKFRIYLSSTAEVIEIIE